MRPRDLIRAILRGEVMRVDDGTDHLLSLRERQAERTAERARLRASAHQSHPDLSAAIQRRRRVM